MSESRVVLPFVVHEVNQPFKSTPKSQVSKNSNAMPSKSASIRSPTRTSTTTKYSGGGQSGRVGRGGRDGQGGRAGKVLRNSNASTSQSELVGQSNVFARAPDRSSLQQSLAHPLNPPSRTPRFHDSEMFTLRPEDETTTFQHTNHRQYTGNGGNDTSAGNPDSAGIAGRYVRPGRTLKFFVKTKKSPHVSEDQKTSTVAADDWDAGKQILKHLNTGEDAISFFAKEGARSAVKFIYLVKADTGSEFRPYDLSVVPGNQFLPGGASGSTHFVMTEKGLTKMTRNPETGVVVPSEGQFFFVLFKLFKLFKLCKTL
jgi:hypothetical protein